MVKDWNRQHLFAFGYYNSTFTLFFGGGARAEVAVPVVRVSYVYTVLYGVWREKMAGKRICHTVCVYGGCRSCKPSYL